MIEGISPLEIIMEHGNCRGRIHYLDLRNVAVSESLCSLIIPVFVTRHDVCNDNLADVTLIEGCLVGACLDTSDR